MTKNLPLPPLEELETLRKSWIKKTVQDGDIARLITILEKYGAPFEIRFYQGNFRKLVRDQYEFTLQQTNEGFDPLGNEYSKKTIITVRDLIANQDFVFLVFFTNSFSRILDDEIRDDYFVVPGKWQEVIDRLWDSLVQEERSVAQTENLRRRKQLVEILHLDEGVNYVEDDTITT